MSDRTSCVSVTSNALFNLLPGNLGPAETTYFQAEHIFLLRDGEVERWAFLLFIHIFILLNKRKLNTTFPH